MQFPQARLTRLHLKFTLRTREKSDESRKEAQRILEIACDVGHCRTKGSDHNLVLTAVGEAMRCLVGHLKSELPCVFVKGYNEVWI